MAFFFLLARQHMLSTRPLIDLFACLLLLLYPHFSVIFICSSPVHYPFKWLKDGVEIAIGPWDCSLGQHPEELHYCQPLSPSDCCEMIQASVGHETDDHGHHLECYVEKEEEPDLQKVVVVLDKVLVNGEAKDVVPEDALPKIVG